VRKGEGDKAVYNVSRMCRERTAKTVNCRGKSAWTGTRRYYGVPADAISVPADSASEIVKFTMSIPRESCTNAKAKYSSSVVPPDPSVHFYHWVTELLSLFLFCLVKFS